MLIPDKYTIRFLTNLISISTPKILEKEDIISKDLYNTLYELKVTDIITFHEKKLRKIS